jgi:methylated-DNA-[protein]-cysteine S-methyltransferase
MINDRDEGLVLDTPVARVEVRGASLGVTRLSFLEAEHSDGDNRAESESVTHWENSVCSWFDVYFSGEDLTFSPLLRPEGTGFQREVWTALRAIPPAQTRTYGEVAEAIGRKGAARAVGQACARNPIPILVPCHRVVPAGEGIGEYSGAEGVKQELLEHELLHFTGDDGCS